MRWLTHTFVVEKHEPPPTWNQSTCHSSLPPSRTLQYNATNDGCSVYSPRQIVCDSDILGAGKIVCNDEHSKGSTEWSSPCGGSDSPHSTWRWNRIINSLSAQAQAAQVSNLRCFCVNVYDPQVTVSLRIFKSNHAKSISIFIFWLSSSLYQQSGSLSSISTNQ